jgi:hypothetical protein
VSARRFRAPWVHRRRRVPAYREDRGRRLHDDRARLAPRHALRRRDLQPNFEDRRALIAVGLAKRVAEAAHRARTASLGIAGEGGAGQDGVVYHAARYRCPACGERLPPMRVRGQGRVKCSGCGSEFKLPPPRSLKRLRPFVPGHRWRTPGDAYLRLRARGIGHSVRAMSWSTECRRLLLLQRFRSGGSARCLGDRSPVPS